MNKIFEEIANIGIIPVIKISDAGKAVPLAESLKRGGIPCAEVTFRTSEAAEAIRNITRTVEDIIVGAGTITTTEQVDLSIESGARFIVTPGFNEKIVKYCLKKEIPVCPGVITPSEIEKAKEFGLKILKFFPAEQSGGTSMIKALAGPYYDVKFIPTGGISESNINDYLDLDCVIACGGSFMVEQSLIDMGKFINIETNCKNIVRKILGFNLKHLMINSNEEKHNHIAEFLEKIGLDIKREDLSTLFRNRIDQLTTPKTNEDIVIGTDNINRAVHYLERKGLKFDSNTIKKNLKDQIIELQFQYKIDGCPIHLVKN